ncbi:MAG: diacylglycerol kinase family lipid kinase [Deltaproteobacteria bacterium]|nr:diacylglycerol kinase family lipid kinase [Deltaproteobacteria bacterium]
MIKTKRIRLIVNPSARSGRGQRTLNRQELDSFCTPGVRVEWIESRCAAHLQHLVHAAQSDTLDAIGLAGGDGTVMLALSALTGPNRVPLAILPIGSGNDFAKDIGVPRSVSEAFRTLLNGTPRWVDVARATPAGDRYCCVASVGLDECALQLIHHSWLPRSKVLNVYAAVRALLTYQPQPVRIAWDGGQFAGPVMFAAVTNTRSYGGGFKVSPEAQVDDGQLNLCIVRNTPKLRLLHQFPRILKGTHGMMPEVTLASSPWVRLESLNSALPVSLDGELPQTTTPIELRCEPRAVQVLVPRSVV